MLALFDSISKGSQKGNIGFVRKYYAWDGGGRGENTSDLDSSFLEEVSPLMLEENHRKLKKLLSGRHKLEKIFQSL
jgi:hypothetical protein